MPDEELGEPLLHAPGSAQQAAALRNGNVKGGPLYAAQHYMNVNVSAPIHGPPFALPMPLAVPMSTPMTTHQHSSYGTTAPKTSPTLGIPGKQFNNNEVQSRESVSFCMRIVAYVVETVVKWFDTYEDSKYVNP